jgi:phosphotransferase system enzyme I (PtsI)
VWYTLSELAEKFQSLSDGFKDRDADIWDLERRLVGSLMGKSQCDLAHIKGEVILVAHDLTPSQAALLDATKIKGILTNAGGRTSHTAIMAHALGIPTIVGLENITTLVTTGDSLIIDGNHGMVLIDPDAAQLLEYRRLGEKLVAFGTSLDDLARLPAKTVDGTHISLNANIEFPTEIKACLAKGAVGIGLYRTEFLFLASPTEPDEEQQYQALSQAIRLLGGKTLTVRTLDLGADKLTQFRNDDHVELNPFLGCRSIRLCLQNLPLFKTQLRAILRASVDGPVQIMFPLISSIMELRQARMILSDVMEDLDEQGIAYGQKIPVGIMIEVPSAAIQAKALATECDFFSIGTNDLIQYTVAVDRSNERIASLYSGAHPAVIQLIRDVVRAANRAKIEVSICGEMGGEPEFIPLLLGLGLRSLSVTPPALPETKRVIRAVTMNQCQRIARKVMAMDSDREVLTYLREEVRKILPDALDGSSIEA